MIQINLLPIEELKNFQYSQKRLPIVPFLVVIFFILIVFWVATIFSLSYYKAITHAKVVRFRDIEPKKAEVDVFWDALHNDLLIKKSHIDTILKTPLPWAQVLNIISDHTSQGIWLTRVDLEQKDNTWLLTIHGFAKPVTSRSMIKDIGNYVTNIKDSIEAVLITANTEQLESEKDMRDFVYESTTTKRKKASNIELTEYVSTFKIKV
jgi:hypothetical protein